MMSSIPDERKQQAASNPTEVYEQTAGCVAACLEMEWRFFQGYIIFPVDNGFRESNVDGYGEGRSGERGLYCINANRKASFFVFWFLFFWNPVYWVPQSASILFSQSSLSTNTTVH